MEHNTNRHYDVVICGAGPAGTTAALGLKHAGLKVAIIDSASFPRDKVCGDAIPARAMDTLHRISSEFSGSFNGFDRQLLTRHTDVVYNGKTLQLHWKIPAYTCPRVDFDNKLFELVKKHTDTVVFEGVHIQTVWAGYQGYVLTDKNGNSYTARLVIGADGAQSVTAKQLAARVLDREHHIGAVRAYYRGIENLCIDKTEMYMEKSLLPGYFWIFPVAGGMANVGFGMVSADIAARKINLKQALYDFIDKVPVLKKRFEHAELCGGLEGHSLPLASRRVCISGTGFMLTGDAASLIDPITGEGIGNAMLSGRLAALQAIRCFQQNDFTPKHMQRYDTEVWQALGKEIRLHTQAQKLLRKMPALLDLVFPLTRWEPVRKLVQDKF